MENYILLEKHKKKISIYFALSILITLWLIQIIFSFLSFYKINNDIEKKLYNKYYGVENIIKNKEAYTNQIKKNNFTTRLIVEKTLEGTTIYENGEKILGDINQNLEEGIYNSKNYKILIKKTIINGKKYNIIITEKNNLSYYIFIINNLYFAIFSMPFGIIFYILGYRFVDQNFKPIKETISSLESFSANINHEMKTPLTEIISTLSLAQKTKDFENAINQSLNSSKKLDKILDSMLGIINLVGYNYKKEKVNIIEKIEELIEVNKKNIKDKNLQLRKEFKQKSFYLNLNKEHFDICVGNILKNAIKYSNNGGRINIKIEKNILEIKDYGIGIENKNLKNIFNRYFRENYTQVEGLGIGLSLAKKIADLNKWEIKIESEKDIGTTAKIIFINDN